MIKKREWALIASLITLLILLITTYTKDGAIQFRRIFGEGPSGIKIEDIKGDSLEIYFCPEDRCEDALVSLIANSKKSINVAMYIFTSRDSAYALVDAAKRGVEVRVYLNNDQRNEKYSKAGFLRKKGIPVKLHDHDGLMHNKFAIIDEEIVATGSFNWTASADTRNDENLVLIKNKKASEAYKKKFDALWERERQ